MDPPEELCVSARAVSMAGLPAHASMPATIVKSPRPAMSLAQIHAAIPYRPPFLFLDEIVEWTDDRILCRKQFSGDEFFYQGHYPGFPLTPGVILCEAGMQAGAVLLSRHLAAEEKGVPVATRINDVRFKHMVRPGDTIEIEVELKERLANAFFLAAKVHVDGKLAVRFEFACTMAQPTSGA
jgi:3-hydroxyacyl-[acyl-carrier-protein] dehydratase